VGTFTARASSLAIEGARPRFFCKTDRLSVASLVNYHVFRQPTVDAFSPLPMSNPLQNSPDQYALRMVNIDKYFGLVRALTSINLDVGRNEIVGLIGDNGAGKSTIVKILTGVFPPTSGELYIADRKVDFRRCDW
jgi:ABC-type glutathione transport system ATPase component